MTTCSFWWRKTTEVFGLMRHTTLSNERKQLAIKKKNEV